ncbi:hypothetical protein VitviT2T_027449 [Vitis vinifera]|uniref:Secreted protein n=2 Tax=Vitis vinifera TaxID=29760 RepID=A0ABY9DQ27_VITVI|nr:hypothetical protein VitviT2T_027449 [Vitis vinifera]
MLVCGGWCSLMVELLMVWSLGDLCNFKKKNRSMVAVMGSGKLFTRTTRALLLGWQCGIAKLWGIHPKRCLKRAHFALCLL